MTTVMNVETTADERKRWSHLDLAEWRQADEAFRLDCLQRLLRDFDRLLLNRPLPRPSDQPKGMETTAMQRALILSAAVDKPDDDAIRIIALLRDFDRLLLEREREHAEFLIWRTERDERIAAAVAAENERTMNEMCKVAGNYFDVPPELEPEPNEFHKGWEMCARTIDTAIRARRKASPSAGESVGSVAARIAPPEPSGNPRPPDWIDDLTKRRTS